MLEIGEKLPLVEVEVVSSQETKIVNLKEYLGKKLLVYAYPRDLTPGCTLQAENLTQFYQELSSQGIEVLGISADSVEKHQKFIEKKELAFSLISDESHELLEKLGVWQLKKFMGREFMGIVRTSFLFDEQGVLMGRIDKPKVKEHAQEVLSLLK